MLGTTRPVTHCAGLSRVRIETIKTAPIRSINVRRSRLNGPAAILFVWGAGMLVAGDHAYVASMQAFGPDYVSFEVNSLSPLTSVRRMSRP